MKKLLSIFLGLSLVLGISSQSVNVTASAPVSNTSMGKAQVSFPLTVKDQLGNEVTIQKKPERIASGYYISSSALIALGLKDSLVAVEEKIQARPIYKLAAAEIIDKVANIGSAKQFDLEACIAAKPDLVILPRKAKDYAASLAEIGIPSIVVSPESHQKMNEMISLLAQVTDNEDRGKELLAYYDEVLKKVEGQTSNLKEEEKPKVYICNPGTYLSTAPKDMYQAYLIRTAGGVNAGDILQGDNWVDVSYEQILSMNPDIIIIPTNNMANGQPEYKAEDIIADPQLSEVNAVKNKKVFNMPAGLEAWDSPVPSGVIGQIWLLATIHPEKQSMDEVKKAAAAFYKKYYGFDMDTSIIQDLPR